MGFSGVGYKLNNVNRSLQKTVGGKFSKGNFDSYGGGVESEYNEKFDKELSEEELMEVREKVRKEVRRDRLKSLVIMFIICPLVIWSLWMIFNGYLGFLETGYLWRI